jgi:hypothetical protein
VIAGLLVIEDGLLQADVRHVKPPTAVIGRVESRDGELTSADVSREMPILRISNIRLDAPSADAPKPSSLLKFDMLNDSDFRVTDVRIEIAIVEKLQERFITDGTSQPHVIVGPFTIRGHATIEAGYTVSYEMLLRNLSTDCGCRAEVRVVSAREVFAP